MGRKHSRFHQLLGRYSSRRTSRSPQRNGKRGGTIVAHPIICKVADILSTRELALNVGSEDGIQKNMEFRIIGNAQIEDPDNMNPPEKIEFTKAEVRVTMIGKYSCVAQTFQRSGINIDMDNFAPELPFDREGNITRPKGVNPQWDKNIEIGDIAIQAPKTSAALGRKRSRKA